MNHNPECPTCQNERSVLVYAGQPREAEIECPECAGLCPLCADTGRIGSDMPCWQCEAAAPKLADATLLELERLRQQFNASARREISLDGFVNILVLEHLLAGKAA